jgi:hypothetical protein
MSEDSLITDSVHQEEVAARVLGDTRLGAFTGQAVTAGVPSSSTPSYTAESLGSLIDLVNGETLKRSLVRLDVGKNSVISIVGGSTNPTSFNFRHRVNASMSDGVVTIDVNEKVGWDGSAKYSGHARSSSGTFADNTFITDVWVIRGTAGAISAQFTVIKEIGIKVRKAILDP